MGVEKNTEVEEAESVEKPIEAGEPDNIEKNTEQEVEEAESVDDLQEKKINMTKKKRRGRSKSRSPNKQKKKDEAKEIKPKKFFVSLLDTEKPTETADDTVEPVNVEKNAVVEEAESVEKPIEAGEPDEKNKEQEMEEA